jgi:hypothetical protein
LKQKFYRRLMIRKTQARLCDGGAGVWIYWLPTTGSS